MVMVGPVAGLLGIMIVATTRSKELPTFEQTMPFLFWGAVITFVSFAILFAWYPLNLYDLFGTINIVVLFITLLYVFIAGLSYYGRKTGYPVAALFFIYLAVINGIGFSSDYYVDATPAPVQGLQGEEQFLKWLENRKDLEDYRSKGRPYPVYIIASAGGGMYAAMRTSYLLEFIQSACPAFIRHTFAVSSVSGGAVGSLVFSAKQAHAPSIHKPCVFPKSTDSADKDLEVPETRILDAFYGRDVVSAIVGGALFPEMLQRVLPLPIAKLSRSHAFRQALRENWLTTIQETVPTDARPPKKMSGSPLGTFLTSCTLTNYWDHTGDFPLQVFNATWVEVGAPIILSNIDPRYYSRVGAEAVFAGNSIEVNMLDSAGISARFPGAMPAGIIASFGIVRDMRLVDGAYFDNSGLLTALSVRDEINHIVADPKNGIVGQVEVHLISLREEYENLHYMNFIGGNRGEWFAWLFGNGGEFGAHATALLQARDRRSLWTMRFIDERETDILKLGWKVSDRAPTGEGWCRNVPLAWYLAPCTQGILKKRLIEGLYGDSFETDKLESQPTP